MSLVGIVVIVPVPQRLGTGTDPRICTTGLQIGTRILPYSSLAFKMPKKILGLFYWTLSVDGHKMWKLKRFLNFFAC